LKYYSKSEKYISKNDCPLRMGMEFLFAFEQNEKLFACSTGLQHAYIPSLLPSSFYSFMESFHCSKCLSGL